MQVETLKAASVLNLPWLQKKHAKSHVTIMLCCFMLSPSQHFTSYLDHQLRYIHDAIDFFQFLFNLFGACDELSSLKWG